MGSSSTAVITMIGTALAGAQHGEHCSPSTSGRPRSSSTRSGRSPSTVPIIVVTAVDDDATIVRALDAGADDYVVKPFRPTRSPPASGRCCGVPSGGRPPSRSAWATWPSTSLRARRPWPAAARAGPKGVRPAPRTRRTGRRGRHQARAARGGVAAGRTAAPTGPSTCTCHGCVASSVRPRPNRATWTACAASAYGWWTRQPARPHVVLCRVGANGQPPEVTSHRRVDVSHDDSTSGRGDVGEEFVRCAEGDIAVSRPG